MRVHPTSGAVVHGVGGGGVFVDGHRIVLAEAGQCGYGCWWVDPSGTLRVLYQARDREIRSCLPDGADDRVEAAQGASWLAAAGDIWIAHQPGRGVLTSWGHLIAGAGAAAVATDASAVFVIPRFAADRGIARYRRGATEPDLLLADVQGPLLLGAYAQVSALSADEFVWRDGWGKLHGHGVTVALPPWSCINPTLFDVDGVRWVSYLRERDELVAHPAHDASRGLISGDGHNRTYGPVGAYHDGRVRLRWSVTSGEGAGDIRVKDFDPAESVDLTSASEPDSIPPIDRALWFGFFEFGGPTDCPVNCRLVVEQGAPWLTVRALDGRSLYRYVAGMPDGDPDAIDRAVASARAVGDGLDVLAYVPRGAAAVRLPDAVVGIECYRRADESIGAFEDYIRRTVARCPRAVLIAQCYTSNHTLSSDVRSVPPVIARVARDSANVEGVLVFSGSGRATGYQDHPSVQPDWRHVAATIQTPGPQESYMRPTDDQILGYVRRAKAYYEAQGVRFKTVEQAQANDYGNYTHDDKRKSFMVVTHALWHIVKDFPRCGFGMEYYGGASGVEWPGIAGKWSYQLFLEGPLGPSNQVMRSGVEPNISRAESTPEAVANWTRDWRPPVPFIQHAPADLVSEVPSPEPEPAPEPAPEPDHESSLLDAPLTPAFPVGYQVWIHRRLEIEAAARDWYTRSRGHAPADPDIAHGLWAALNEPHRWGTLRRAFEASWPGGAPR